MKMLSPTVRTAIAIDLGSRAIKVVQAWVKRGAVTRIAHAGMSFSGETAFSPAQAGQIAALLRRGGFAGRAVVIAVPPRLLRMEGLELPKVVPAAVPQLAEMEIGRVSRLRPKSFEHGLWELPMPSRGGSSMHVMSVALPHADADALVNPFLDAGLDVVAVVPQVSALASLVARILPDEDQLHTIIDIGAGGTRLIILQRGAVLFHRGIDNVGTSALQQSVQADLAVPDTVAAHILQQHGIGPSARDGLGASAARVQRRVAGMIETIAAELQLTQNYITHRYQQQTSSSLLLAGGGAAIPGFAEALGAATDRQSTILSPRSFSNLLPPDSRDDSPATVAALAAALYTLGENS